LVVGQCTTLLALPDPDGALRLTVVPRVQRPGVQVRLLQGVAPR